MPSKRSLGRFVQKIWDYYQENQRIFAWRQTSDPYHILVSEVMLQQTQTYRVAPKYELFIEQFPNIEVLATAHLRDVLTAWQGLGYNRRAIALQKTAQCIMHQHNGTVPNQPEILQTLPGIGPATAASICAFTYNKSTVFIETNIRAVYIHFFFQHKEHVTDKEIYPLVQATCCTANPRHWYYALMDYGVMLKKKYPNPSRKSAHHTTQSKFEGSDRQIRGMIIRLLTQNASLTYNQIIDCTQKDPQRVRIVLTQLIKEQFVQERANIFSIIPST